MKKLFSIVTLLILVCGNCIAQNGKDPQAIFDRYCEVIGVTDYNSNGSNSAMVDMTMNMPGAKIAMNVISQRPNQYRAEMEVQGTKIDIIGDDKVAYVTTQGQTQKITDKAQIEQLLPFTDLTKELVPEISEGTNLTYKGTNSGCDIVEVISPEATLQVYYNIKTGLIDKITTDTQGQSVVVRYKDYKEFAGGELLIPSKMITEVMGQRITIEITDFVADYPTAAWMFAAPQL